MLNSVALVGRLSAEPELRTTPSGVSVCNVCLAVGRDGKDETDWIDCTAWNKAAEFIARYLHKGSLVSVSGSLQTRTYQDRDGKNRKVTEVQVFRVNGLDKREAASAAPVEIPDEELPF